MGFDNQWHLVKGKHVSNGFVAVSLLERQCTQEKATKPMEWQWTHGNEANWNSNEPMAMKPIETAMSSRQWSQLNGNEPVALKQIETAMNLWHEAKWKWQ
jgi:hypothetical protein